VPPKKLPANDPNLPEAPLPINTLIKRAQRGDESVMPQLRRLLDGPGGKYFRDLAGSVRDALIRKFARDDRLARELFQREMIQLRAELLGPAPTAVERLLVERVAVGWLEVHTAEYQLAVQDAQYREHWQRQVDHAHRRFLAALRLLTAVRRLPRPALQVNIGEQQVNVVG
jgi:hypothetical protein